MMRSTAWVLLGVIGLLGGCAHLDMKSTNTAAPVGTGFSVREISVDAVQHKYGLFVPLAYQPNIPMPAIVFLHGILEAGSDGRAEMGQGLGPNIARRTSTFPFIAIFPQSGGEWTGEGHDRLAMAVLDDAQKHCNIDRDRIILTGVSSGGFGVWHIGSRHADRFAALVPVCGPSDGQAVQRLTQIPIWCFHNSGDFLVNSANSRDMVAKIRAAGGNVRYTQFSAIGHACWDKVYGDPKVIDWMLAQRRGH